MKQLYPVQSAHAGRLYNILCQHGSALDSSETGCGKTVVAAEIAWHHPGPILVVAPKAVLPAWRRELDERGVVTYDVINYELLRVGKTKHGHWDKKTWKWDLPKDCLIIFDEVRRCAGITTKNAKILIEAKDRYKVLMLSATIASSPTQLRAAGYLLGLHSLGNFWQWCLKNGCAKNRFNGIDFLGNPSHIESIAKQLSPRVSRMTVADLADHFTETQIISEPLDFGDEIGEVYAEMEKELLALEAVSKKDSKNKTAEALIAQLRARQRVELLKVPIIEEMIGDLLDEGKSVAIFVNFQQTIEALRDRFGTRACGYAEIHGDQNADTRQANIDAFQKDEVRVIVCNIAAGGVGISLHDLTGKHPRASIISPSWSEDEIIQAVGRVHRAGGKTPSMQRILFAAGTVEEKVEKEVRKKIQNLNLLNEKSACSSDVAGITYPSPRTEPLENMTPKTNETICHTDATTRPHAEFSPSALKLFEACPSYRSRGGSNAIAEAGTRIHEAIEKEAPTMLADETERELAEWCLKFISHIRRSKSSGANLVASHREIFLEMSMGEHSTYGTSDLLDIYSDKTAVMFDYKTGYNLTEDAEINSQVWAYTLGVFQKFANINELAFYLVYPRRGEISFATFKRSDVDKIILRLSTIIARAKEGKIETPAQGVCIYCSKQGSCKALADIALKVADRAGYKIPPKVSLEGSSEERANLMRLAGLMEDWGSATKKEGLRQVLEEGAEIKDFRLEHRKTPRGITEPLLGYEALKEMVSIEEYLLAVKSVSIPTLEKLAAERAPKGKKKAVMQALEDALRDAGALKDEGEIHLLREIKS